MTGTLIPVALVNQVSILGIVAIFQGWGEKWMCLGVKCVKWMQIEVSFLKKSV
jgi:hypothetical protein